MSEVSPITIDAPVYQIDENDKEEQEIDREGHRLVLPEDGHEWKKYGQKFIKNIGKFRSYFKCQKANCMAKKRADWCISEPANIRIVYDGIHTHGPLAAEPEAAGSSYSSSSNTNQYNLLTQVFGVQSSTQPCEQSCRDHKN